jgi:hypothetical protein
MNIYVVGPVANRLDEYDKFVVAASSPTEARQLAHDQAKPLHTFHGSNAVLFLTAPVRNIGKSVHKTPRIILGSFNAG